MDYLALFFYSIKKSKIKFKLSYSILSKYFNHSFQPRYLSCFLLLSFFFFLCTHFSSKQINRVQLVPEFQRCVRAHSNDVCAMMMIACHVTGLCNSQRVNHIWYHHCWRSLRRCSAHRLQRVTRIVTSMDRGSWLRSDCRRIISWFELLVIRVIGYCSIYLVLRFRFSFLLRVPCSRFLTNILLQYSFVHVRRIRKSVHTCDIYFWEQERFNLILINTMKS